MSWALDLNAIDGILSYLFNFLSVGCAVGFFMAPAGVG